jgi:AcrR family transcriptional regulator
MTERSHQPGKQEAKRLRTRDAVLRAATACLVEQGYADTTIARVAERAGVSKGALQHHFPSKEELTTAVADRLLQRSIERFPPKDPALPREHDGVAVDLMMIWTSLIDTDAYRALLEILVAARTDARLQARISPTLHGWNVAIDRAMSDRYEAVAGAEGEVELLMLMSRSLMRGLLIQERYTDDAGQMRVVIKRWVALVAPLLRSRAHPQ